MRSDQHPTPDALVDLELAVARRADELAGAGHCPTPLNLHCWLQAEQEILGAAQSLAPRRTSSADSLAECA